MAKKADKEYQRSYYLKHRAKKLAERREYRATHLEEEKARAAEYRSRPDIRERECRRHRQLGEDDRQKLHSVLLYYDCQNPHCGSRSAGHVAEELQFHHLDPASKECTVSALLKCKKSRIMGEINKCVVLCANCHRRAHTGLFQAEESMLCLVDETLHPVQKRLG